MATLAGATLPAGRRSPPGRGCRRCRLAPRTSRSQPLKKPTAPAIAIYLEGRTATIRWDVPTSVSQTDDDPTRPLIRSYKYQYSAYINGTADSYKSGTATCASGFCLGNVTVVLPGLTPNTNYSFIYTAVNSEGDSPPSDESTFNTLFGTPEVRANKLAPLPAPKT